MSPFAIKEFPDKEVFLKKAVRVADHYGFSPFSKIQSRAERKRVRAPQLTDYRRTLDAHASELLSALKGSLELNACKAEEPLLFYHTNVDTGRSAKPKTVYFGLQVMGVERSIAEAIVLRTALAILDELGMDSPCVHVNSIGDRDSLARMYRELSGFFRKHIQDLPPSLQQSVKKDVLYALAEIYQKEDPLSERAPRTIEYLNEVSRKHLWEVIEYLETFDARYEIDNGLIGHKDCYSQTLFEIRDGEGDEVSVVARGGRYDELSRKLFRKQIPAVGLLFTCWGGGRKKVHLPPIRSKKPNIYYLHLGREAKMKSLLVLEDLRRARLPVAQSLPSESLSAQLREAESLRVPIAVIMGYKEAMEDAVIVRNMETRSQETIPTANLPFHLQSLLRRR